MKHFANITVIGRDKTGVVAKVTNFLFEQRANIVIRRLMGELYERHLEQ